jgi:hypothetical protein
VLDPSQNVDLSGKLRPFPSARTFCQDFDRARHSVEHTLENIAATPFAYLADIAEVYGGSL